ncbi:MAG: PPOX class F420-dependent oxidoreductase [Actinobacteria bacterium]|nr:PPOX class F420-dependent oxidoreductase [Actinomycetota bacterium]
MYLMGGTRTGHLATVREDGRPHVAPVWFVLDGDDIVFMTGADTVKGRNLRRTGRAAMSVDDPTPPYAFVHVAGIVELTDCGDDFDTAWPYGLAISARYMGDDRAEQYAWRNTVPGELLVRLTPQHVSAQADLAD